jgi:BirA family biotin operon repressor/biotin-[acetyl-CoA-carboxylase] ligase
LVAAVALIEIISLYAGDESVRLKWPNDILADGAKLSGILLERIGDAVVVGFGVNIADAPAVPDRATSSIAQIVGSVPDVGVFLEDLARSFERWLGNWRASPSSVRARWMEYAHPLGTPLAVHESEGRVTEGLFQGIDSDGSLRLRLADGSEHVIQAGDVFLI